MTPRFTSTELLNLGPPPRLASLGFETIVGEAKARLVTDFAAIGINYDVGGLETDPAIVLTQSAAYRELLTRAAIDDAVAGTYLGSAVGASLDARAADYGVVRRAEPHTIPEAAPANRPPAIPPQWAWNAATARWVEDDEMLRLRARLSWEALSVAGPAGAYVFHALGAHPGVRSAVAYGPESGHVEPGEVLVVIMGHAGVPTTQMVDSVAEVLDAAEVQYATGSPVARPVRDEQSIRPLGARVIVKAAALVSATITATLYIRPGTEQSVISATARARIEAYLARRRDIGLEVPRSAIIAAVHVADAAGLPVIEEVLLSAPTEDLVPTHTQVINVTAINLTVEVR